MSFGRPGVDFSDFGVPWKQAINFMIFERFPRGPRVEEIHRSGGKSLVRGVQ